MSQYKSLQNTASGLGSEHSLGRKRQAQPMGSKHSIHMASCIYMGGSIAGIQEHRSLDRREIGRFLPSFSEPHREIPL